MKVVCRDRQKSSAFALEGRALSSVAADINNLLSPKSYEGLEVLEAQVKHKLNSNEPIDTDYWEELLRSLSVWKARAKLKTVYQAVIEGRVQSLHKQQREEADFVRTKLAPIAPIKVVLDDADQSNFIDQLAITELDPEPLLQLHPEDKGLEVLDEALFLEQVVRFFFLSFSFPRFYSIFFFSFGKLILMLHRPLSVRRS
jgi:Conserved mid region of cactin